MQKQNFTLIQFPTQLIRVLCLSLIALLLSACDPSIYSTDSTPVPNNDKQTPASLAQQGRHRAAAIAYRRLAVQSNGMQRDKYFLEAADQWFREQNFQESQKDLYNITGILDSKAQVRKVLLQARIELELDNPAKALTTLTALRPENAPDIARPYYALQAIALFKLGRLHDGTEAFLTRTQYLRSLREVEENQRRLWNNLSTITTEGIQDTTVTDNNEVTGWVSLAQNLAFARNRQQQLSILEAWREDFPEHPAYRFASTGLPEIKPNSFASSGSSVDFSQVNTVAVLIPLSGRLGRAGEVIRQGIEASNQASNSAYKLQFFDTGTDILKAFTQAMQSQPDAIIGPLDKNNIQTISSRIARIPTIALNRAFDESLNVNLSDLLNRGDSTDPTSRVNTDNEMDNKGSSLTHQPSMKFSNLLQFGLAPEDEARVAANAALANGHTQMITFTPSNEWGDRVLNSFAQAFVEGGGRLLEASTYSTRENDHSDAIKGLLNLDESRNRYAQVSALFGDVEYEPRRRQDVDAIFIAAQPNQGRLIRPQLKFHYANRLPVYANSGIYTADATRNKDINGINLPLSAWETRPFSSQPELAQRLNILSEEQTPNTQVLRLFSLGYDALSYMQHYALSPNEELMGLSGSLKADDNGLIRRDLPMVKIINGQPNP